jgi:SAM-dependent methyltransferase
MKTTNWNQYLSSDNPWSKRLLGLEKWSITRDVSQIEREYNQDKYGKLLSYDLTHLGEYIKKQIEGDENTPKNKFIFSIEDELFEADVNIASTIYQSIISQIVQSYNPHRICELGCGYGQNFSYLKKICAEVYGGEYSRNAVKIGTQLGLEINEFNYYNLEDYKIIKKGSLVLTCHSVEQLPSAEIMIQGFLENRHNIDVVVHFEPTFLPARSSFVGLLRNRYIELNNYNMDLVSLLFERHRNDIDVIEFRPDVIGLNPLNSTNMIVWKFK